MTETCSTRDCTAPVLARQLCSSHYQRAKYARRLDEVAPTTTSLCGNCGGEIPATRRWGAKFCSADCKEAAMAAAKHQRMLERRAAMRARACAWCRKPLTVIRDDQRFCSHKCGDDWRNDQKRLANLRAKKAARTPCEVCGGRIPAERAASAIYCSVACKQLGGRSGHPAVRRDQTDYNRRYLYGITAEQFAAMLEEQNNLCAICRSPEWPGKGSRPHVDHDHATGKVRGLLCGKCNVALGNMHDDPVRLRAAAAYVEAHMA